MICLRYFKPSYLTLVENGVPQGMCLLLLPESSPALYKWKQHCGRSKSGIEFFSPSLLRSSISNLITRLLSELRSLRAERGLPESELQISNTSSDKALSLTIRFRQVHCTVELLPAVECTGVWPSYARPGPWPTSGSGISPHGVHVVAKHSGGGYQWRIWFCHAERHVLQFSNHKCKLECFRLMKKVVFGELGCTFLTSYHLLTMLLHESARLAGNNNWADCRLKERVYDTLVYLHRCLVHGECSHFFVPTLNLFSHLSVSAMREFAERLLKYNKKAAREYGKTNLYEDVPEEDVITVIETWL
ncbi:protein mab-21-like [Nematostella vectensis]|uniref:protein mab-21-like n=1 Tax=Nematostella vectensis TaxID=45351 RepID=UPI0020771E9B|nr:protein mab-21-like [Nematostella vectensis]